MYYSNKGSVLIFILIVFSIVSTITMMCIGLNYSNSRINNLNYQNIVMKESLLSSIELVHSNILKEVSIALENSETEEEFKNYFLGNIFVNNIKNLFVDIKDKYINYGIRCINYVSLKNLLDCANVEFYGDAHDPLYDAYNLFILDKTLENSEETRNILTIKDIVRQPFTVINENLEYIFEEYRINLYGNNSDEIHKDISIEILKTIRIYIESIKQIDIYNIEILRDINRKLEVINNLKDLKVGYFFLLENLYFDMKDLFDDLMLYKVTTTEYKEEIENIILLFNEDLLYEGIDFEYILEESC